MLEILSQEIYDKLPSPRVINTHLHYKYLPLDTRKRQCKIVLCIRNPKDVAVSDFNLHTSLKIYNFSGKWEHYVERFLNNLGICFLYMYLTNTYIPTHVQLQRLSTNFKKCQNLVFWCPTFLKFMPTICYLYINIRYVSSIIFLTFTKIWQTKLELYG